MSHFKKRIELLKNLPFLAYLVSCLFASFGNGLGYISMSWLVVSHHNSVAALTLLMICFWGPNILLGPFMGVLADRLSRKTIIVISCLLRAIIFIGFGDYLLHYPSLGAVYCMMALIGICFSAFFSTVFAFTRELVPPGKLIYANATIDMAYEIGNVVGMGSAGIIIGMSSIETAILINGLAFLFVTLATIVIPKSALRYSKQQKTPKLKLLHDFKQGLKYIIHRRQLMAVYVIQMLIFSIYLTAPVLLAPFGKAVLHTDVSQFGYIEASLSMGVIIGGILIPWLSEIWGFRNTLAYAVAALTVVFIWFGYNRSITIAECLYFVVGFSGSIWPLIISRAQEMTEIGYQGRVQSTFNSISGMMVLVCYLSVGGIGEYVGFSHLYWIEVFITGVALVLLWKFRQQFTVNVVESNSQQKERDS